jgi:hypothetical protein
MTTKVSTSNTLHLLRLHLNHIQETLSENFPPTFQVLREVLHTLSDTTEEELRQSKMAARKSGETVCFEVYTVVAMKSTVFHVVTLCSSREANVSKEHITSIFGAKDKPMQGASSKLNLLSLNYMTLQLTKLHSSSEI